MDSPRASARQMTCVNACGQSRSVQALRIARHQKHILTGSYIFERPCLLYLRGVRAVSVARPTPTMLMLAVVVVVWGTFLPSPVAQAGLLGVEAAGWAALNRSVRGSLHFTLPFELPCFSSFENSSEIPDPVACALVQQSYTDPVFRSEHFGAYMNVSIVFCLFSPALLTCSLVGMGDVSNYWLRVPPGRHQPDESSSFPGQGLQSGQPCDGICRRIVRLRCQNMLTEIQVDVQDVQDIQAALAWSRQTGVRLTVKNKGHDYKGRSSGRGTAGLWV